MAKAVRSSRPTEPATPVLLGHGQVLDPALVLLSRLVRRLQDRRRHPVDLGDEPLVPDDAGQRGEACPVVVVVERLVVRQCPRKRSRGSGGTCASRRRPRGRTCRIVMPAGHRRAALGAGQATLHPGVPLDELEAGRAQQPDVVGLGRDRTGPRGHLRRSRTRRPAPESGPHQVSRWPWAGWPRSGCTYDVEVVALGARGVLEVGPADDAAAVVERDPGVPLADRGWAPVRTSTTSSEVKSGSPTAAMSLAWMTARISGTSSRVGGRIDQPAGSSVVTVGHHACPRRDQPPICRVTRARQFGPYGGGAQLADEFAPLLGGERRACLPGRSGRPSSRRR